MKILKKNYSTNIFTQEQIEWLQEEGGEKSTKISTQITGLRFFFLEKNY